MKYEERESNRVELSERWAVELAIAAATGRIGRPPTLKSFTSIRGPRACVLEMDAGFDSGDLLKALKKDDAATLRQTVPWRFGGEPRAYFRSRYVRVEAEWPMSIQERDIKLQDINRHPVGRGRWVAGMSETGSTVVLGLTDEVPHYLFAGSTGSGKTYAMRQAVAQLSAGGARLVLVDGKMGDGLEVVRQLPGIVGPLAIDLATARAALLWVSGEMKRRFEKGRDFIEAQKPLAVVVDEVQEFAIEDEAISEMVARIARQGRAAKVHLLVGTQHPTMEMFGGDSTTRRNLRGRVALKVEDDVASRVAIGASEPHANWLSGKGDAFIVTPNHTIRTQLAYIPDHELARLNGGQRELHDWPEYQAEDLGSEWDPCHLAEAIICARDGAGRPALESRTGLGSSAGRRLLKYGQAVWAELLRRSVCGGQE